jgi:hypothetical protein
LIDVNDNAPVIRNGGSTLARLYEDVGQVRNGGSTLAMLYEDVGQVRNGGSTLATLYEAVFKRRFPNFNLGVSRFQGVHVGYIIAEDADMVDVRQLRYSLVDAEPHEALELFAIQDDVDTNRGIVTVGGDLTDRWGLYRLTVMVSEDRASLCAELC